MTDSQGSINCPHCGQRRLATVVYYPVWPLAILAIAAFGFMHNALSEAPDSAPMWGTVFLASIAAIVLLRMWRKLFRYRCTACGTVVTHEA